MGSFRHLIPHFKRQAGLFALGVAALLLTDYVEQYLPRLLKDALDALQYARPGAGRAALLAVLGWMGLRLGFVALQGGLRWGWRMGFFGMSRRVEYAMRRQLFGKLLELDAGFFRRLRVGDLLSRAMSDLTAVRESLGYGWLSLVDGVAMVAFTTCFMLRADARLSLEILWPMAFVPALVMTLGRKVRDNQRRSQDLLDSLSQTATESFSGARVIHAYARQGEEQARFGRAVREYRLRGLKLAAVEAVYWPLLWLLAGISEVLLLLHAGPALAAHRLSVGGFAMFQTYLYEIQSPVMSLGNSSNAYYKGRVSIVRLNEVYDAASGLAETAAGEVSPLPGAPVAECRSVVRRRGDGPAVLAGVDLAVRQGEWVGVAGRLGCGKTTLLRLFPRLDDVDAGAALLWGRDLRDWPLQSLRKRVALVAQEPFIFSESVLENIAFAFDGDPAARLEQAREAARLADLESTIAGLPQGYATLIGERGVNLSGGQKQRLALARALFARPDLLLLDDAFSAVDTATEERIVSRLRLALPGTAVLMVSHRVSTLQLCDRVLVLEGGRVASQGSPAELLQQEGAFFEMASRERLARRVGLA